MAKNKLYEAIEMIEDVNVLNNLQEEFNSICEKQRLYLQVIDEANNINSNSFFFIKESFTNLTEKLFESEKGRKLINKFIKEHKANKELQKMYFIHENISTANKTLDVASILTEMKEIVGDINENKLNEGIKNLKAILKEAYVTVGEDAKNLLSTHDNNHLDESIKYVFNNSKKLDNITYYNICINEIKKHIESNKVVENIFEKKIDIDAVLSEFNSKFSKETMGEDNYNIVKEIHETENKKEVFEKYKNNCIRTIDEAIEKNIDQITCNQLHEFKTRLLTKEFNSETLGVDIANFIELTNTINE